MKTAQVISPAPQRRDSIIMTANHHCFQSTKGVFVVFLGLICLPFHSLNGLLISETKGVLPRLGTKIARSHDDNSTRKEVFLLPSKSLLESTTSSPHASNENVSLKRTPTTQKQQSLFSTSLSTSHSLQSLSHGSTMISLLHDQLLVEPIRQHILQWQDQWYDQALHLRCPFWRRRATDAVEVFHEIARTVLDPQEHWLGPNPSLVCHGKTCTKRFGQTIHDVMEAIRLDWHEDSNLGYYVTGKLSTDVYRDDCFFDGPDPDMPVKGLRKYVNAASQLFDQRQSWSKLLSIEILDESSIVAHWQFKGILRLPWKPILPMVQGSTMYHIDSNGLVFQHVEKWDVSVQEAFLRTFFPFIFPPR